MDTDFSVSVRFFRLSPELQPYFNALTLYDLDCDPHVTIEDHLHPEWPGLHFHTAGPVPVSAIGTEPMTPRWPIVAHGPTSKAVRFTLSRSRIVSLGLQPAAWAQFVAEDASEYANRIFDGGCEPAMAPFAPILSIVEDPHASPEQIAERINALLLRLLGPEDPRISQVRCLHEALNDPEVSYVAELGERAGLGLRSLERACLRHFGFPPKLLLRRQRFLRSLARYMLSGPCNWSEAIDGQYYDQAQFVRDFRSFMGMTPSEYAERPHPILSRILAQRMADIGAAAQTDLPTALRYMDQPEKAGEEVAKAARRR